VDREVIRERKDIHTDRRMEAWSNGQTITGARQKDRQTDKQTDVNTNRQIRVNGWRKRQTGEQTKS
jgi:hypothetical protein